MFSALAVILEIVFERSPDLHSSAGRHEFVSGRVGIAALGPQLNRRYSASRFGNLSVGT